MAYIMALDAGTTQVKVALFDQEGRSFALSECKVDVSFPEPGFVEQDPEQIYRAAIEAINDAMQKANVCANQVVALGITNQRINVIMWDSRTGKPVCNAMGWQDQRGPEMTPGFVARHTVEFTLASLVAGKILWLFKKIPDLRSRAEAGEVIFGGIDTWLLWKLTSGQVHATDVSNASTTILYDVERARWNPEILAEANIPLNIFPAVMDSAHIYGHVSTRDLAITCPIAALAADQQASLFGHRCFSSGQAKITFGTGSFVLANMGINACLPPPGIIKHAAWSIKGKVTFALEGSIFSSGSALEWLVDGLGLVRSLEDLEPLAASVESNDGVFFVPALAGLGSPSWDTKARGLLIGLTRGTQKGHIARAALDSLAFQVREVIDIMSPVFSGTQCLRIDGRPTINKYLVQTLADTCQLPIERASNFNVTLAGAAYLAGLSSGVWSSLDEIMGLAVDYEVFRPQHDMEKNYILWQKAVGRSYSWLE
jgi:glycerol kinase